MKTIRFKTWLFWAVVLFCLGLVADYFFLHALFQENMTVSPAPVPALSSAAAEVTTVTQESAQNPPPKDPINESFLLAMKACHLESSALNLTTPEAFLQHLRTYAQFKSEEFALKNYHLVLKDQSERRIQLVTADNTNSQNKFELRFFKLDQEGYPERIPLKESDTFEKLVNLGTVVHTEMRSELFFTDGSTLQLEDHDGKVFEMQFHHQGQTLSCRQNNCLCR